VPWGLWWRRSRETHGNAGALPSREAGSGAVEHVAVRLAPCLGLEDYMHGYRVYRVPIVAPDPTSGEAANP
jgi:hypothetical protein